MGTSIYPTKNRIVVDPKRDIGEVKVGGIILPSTRKEGRIRYGTVLAVGPGVKQREELKPGVVVYFDHRKCGVEVRLIDVDKRLGIDGKDKVLIIEEGDIIAIEVNAASAKGG